MPVALAVLLGVVAGAGIAPPIVGLFAGLAVTAVQLRRAPRAGAVLVLWFVLGAARVWVWERHPAMTLATRLPSAPAAVRAQAVVRGDPGVVEEGHGGFVTTVLDVRYVDAGGGWARQPGRLRLECGTACLVLRDGDVTLLDGVWSRTPAPGNPGEYDRARAWRRDRIAGLLRVRPYDAVVVLGREASVWRCGWLRTLRRRWVALTDRLGKGDERLLWRSLLLGERVRASEPVQRAFRETGTMHLLVISGFHIGLMVLVLEGLLRVLSVPRRLRHLLAAGGATVYCGLVGANPPAVRATVMAWAALGALALDRPVAWLQVTAAAVLAMLWIHPLQLFDPSFQLSVGAVLSLILLAGPWTRALFSRVRRWPASWAWRFLVGGLTATAAVWVGLWPVLAWYFFIVTPAALLANLLLVPLVSLLVVLGTTVLAVGSVAEPVVSAAAPCLNWLLQGTLAVVSWCHRLGPSAWVVGRPSAGTVVGYYGLLALTAAGRGRGWSWRRLGLVWLAAIAVTLGGAAGAQVAASRWLELTVLDVGHGDSLFIRTPRGRTLLVDAGTADAARWRVVPYLRRRGIRRVDALIVTHADEDHAGGVLAVLDAMPVGRFLTNGASDATMTLRRAGALADARRVPRGVLQEGKTVGAMDVRVEVWHPPAGFVPRAAPAENDNSIVLRVTHGAISMLLTGDLEEVGVRWWLAHHPVPPVTVLKVPHHGSALGEAGSRWLKALRPQVAVISVGRLHRLPHASMLRALEQAGARVLLTRDHGAVRIRTDGTRLRVDTVQ